VGTNWIVFRRAKVFATLPRVDRRNRLKESYLNRAISLMLAEGERVDAIVCDTGGTLGLNSRGGLAAVIAVVRDRINERHMDAGQETVAGERPRRI
jgi:bifunctional UDP-N-acetylglucosamine pyrophosphorylase/glucosamine-1-phosphate N-acetyltransferase